MSDEVFLNELAQELRSIDTGVSWFEAKTVEERRATLRTMNVLVIQAGALDSDAPAAILRSGLSARFTPSVLIQGGALKVQLAKIGNLPENELTKAFRLILALFAVADGRRRSTSCAAGCTHWWHHLGGHTS